MGEAIIARGQTASKNVLDDVPVVQGVCSILVKVTDSSGESIPNCPVWCKDGSTNYNYNTNAEGYTLFQCNSGAANIIAQNFSILDKYNMVDQLPATTNEDAPVGTKKLIAMSLGSRAGTKAEFPNNIPNARFMVTHMVPKVITIGGGSSGGLIDNYGDIDISGGGGGAYNQIINVKVDKFSRYNFIIGAGGKISPKITAWQGQWANNYGWGSGGTTSALGISSVGGKGVNGGGSGSYKGADGDNGARLRSDQYGNTQYQLTTWPEYLMPRYNDLCKGFNKYGVGFGGGFGDALSYVHLLNNAQYGPISESIISVGNLGTRNDSTGSIYYSNFTYPKIYGAGGGGGGIISGGWGYANPAPGKQGVIFIQF